MPVAKNAIQIAGLREFNRDLKRISADAPKALRLAGNKAAQLVVDWARPRVASRSGRAARSVRALSTRTATRVAGGSRRVPYFPWLDYGGRVGPARSVSRPFRKEGRYIYQGFYARRDQVGEVLGDELRAVARSTGWDVR